jgi:heme/copper-type cytochrome/quinol oxidase subunit 1
MKKNLETIHKSIQKKDRTDRVIRYGLIILFSILVATVIALNIRDCGAQPTHTTVCKDGFLYRCPDDGGMCISTQQTRCFLP